MKKAFAYILCLLICCSAFTGCSENIAKYKNNENDNYINDDNFEGGDKQIKNSYLRNIDLSWLLGPEKLIFDIQNDEQSNSQLPYYNIKIDNDTNKIEGTIYSCILQSKQNLDISKSKLIDNFSISQQGDDIVFILVLKQENNKVRVDEYSQNGKLVISLAEINPVETE